MYEVIVEARIVCKEESYRVKIGVEIYSYKLV